MSAHQRVLDALQSAGCKIATGGRASTCPAHDDHAPSLSIGARSEGDAGVVLNCHAGCSAEDVTAAVGLTVADLFDARGAKGDGKPLVVATYHYTDEAGTVFYEKLRLEPKTFRQCRQVDGRTVWSLGDVPRVLYRLPEVVAAIAAGEPVYLAEGEKDADALAAASHVATTWTEGAWKPGQRPKWRDDYTEALRGATVVIVRDRDETGRHTAATIASTLAGVAASVDVVEPVTGKDVSDHLAAGRRVDELEAVADDEVPPPSRDLDVEVGSSWTAVDLAETVAGVMAGTISRPAPTIGRRTDGQALFYAGKVNGVAGASNAGKSWTGFYTCAQEIAAGEHVVYIDLEDDVAAAVARLLDLAVPPEAIVARFHYVPPAEAFTYAAAEALGTLLERVNPTVVVIDSTGESMALDGAKPNDDDDVARWFRRLPTAVARRCGAAVIVLDHVTKAEDGGLWPIGSQRKRAAIGGAQYMQVNVRPFDRSTAGYSKLVCAKDRHGNYHQGQTVALLHVTPTSSGVDLQLRVPAETSSSGIGTWRPTAIMERVSRALEVADEPMSVRAIESAVQGKKDHVKVATEALVSDGHVGVTIGARNARMHTLVTPYRQADDPRCDLYRPPGDSQPGNDPDPLSDRPRPLRGGTGDGQSDRPRGTVGGRWGTVTCGHHDCIEPARPGKVMCGVHFTREPVAS